MSEKELLANFENLKLNEKIPDILSQSNDKIKNGGQTATTAIPSIPSATEPAVPSEIDSVDRLKSDKSTLTSKF